MSWEKWVLIGWMTYGAVGVVLAIGKPRIPATPEMAAAVLAVTAASVALVVFA